MTSPYIVYPGGSHGNFLKFLLNTLSNIPTHKIKLDVYDNVVYLNNPVFLHCLDIRRIPNGHPHISIKVQRTSYLKYFAICLNRTSGNFISIEELGSNTFKKIESHIILKYFSKKLSEISNKKSGDVESKHIRQWLQFCFFANRGMGITGIIAPTLTNTSIYTVDFESFYDGTILNKCYQIYKLLGLDINPAGINKAKELVKEFPTKVKYYNIDSPIDKIIYSINNNIYFDLSSTNLLQQAWIDNYLVEKYHIEPFITNQYFSNTHDLIGAYKLTAVDRI